LSRANRKERVQYQPQSAPNLIEIRHYLKKKTQVNLVPRNLSQESYIDMLKNPKKYIVFAIGPAGTGKTMLGVQMAIKKLQESEIKKIVITRPAVSVDEDLGFLPGTLNQKMEPWVIPILDVFKEYYHPKEIQDLMENGTLEIAPLGMMRGRTFKDTYIVADEMQNTTQSQMKMLLTRLGDNSRMIVTGDLNQADRLRDNGLLDFVNRTEQADRLKLIDIAWFTRADVERHPVVKEILTIYNDEE
jgi:phosphate starvation-inducible PhoH-like protein